MKEIARKIEALALFDSLAELPAEECNARLAALAASNPDLVLEVRKLLQADAASSGLLDHGIRGVADTLPKVRRYRIGRAKPWI